MDSLTVWRQDKTYKALSENEQAQIRLWIALGLPVEVSGYAAPESWIPWSKAIQSEISRDPAFWDLWCYRLRPSG